MAKGKPSPGSDSERRFEVLLEQIRSEVHTIAEGHSLLAKELRETKEMLEKRLTFLEQATVEGFNKVWETLREVNVRIDTTNERLDGANKQLAELNARFDAHERAHAG